MDVTAVRALGRWPGWAVGAPAGRPSRAAPASLLRRAAGRADFSGRAAGEHELERRRCEEDEEGEEEAGCSHESQYGLTRRRNALSRLGEFQPQVHRISVVSEKGGRTLPLRVRSAWRRDELGRRSGRRAFSWSGVLGLVALSLTAGSGGVRAEKAAAPKPKIKGRPPSSPYDEDRLLEQNRRMQKLNNAPVEFPGFVREGFQVKVITSDKYVKSKSGLIYYDMVVGAGDLPQDGQQVIFHYTGYNESGRRVDSSYQQGRPARTRIGIQGMIPGFEEGIKSMRAGGRRIIIVPPELGPPVGPSTFFSAKQFEVFDVELLEAKDCNRRTLLFYSDVVCD